jgi:hypothetical protein
VSDAVPPSEPVHPSPGGAPDGPDGFGAADTAEVELDVHAFLPEGVVLGDPDADPDADSDAELGAAPGEEADLDGSVDGRAGARDALEAISEPAPAAEPGPDLAALDQVQADLDAVDAAIAALDAGTYGIDPATGEPFDDELLAADPTRLR